MREGCVERGGPPRISHAGRMCLGRGPPRISHAGMMCLALGPPMISHAGGCV